MKIKHAGELLASDTVQVLLEGLFGDGVEEIEEILDDLCGPSLVITGTRKEIREAARLLYKEVRVEPALSGGTP